MQVAEVHALVPKAAVYELDPKARYLVIVPVLTEVSDLVEGLTKVGMQGVIMAVEDPSEVRILTLGEAT